MSAVTTTAPPAAPSKGPMRLAWISFLLGLGASLAANVLGSWDNPDRGLAVGLGVWPAVAFLACTLLAHTDAHTEVAPEEGFRVRWARRWHRMTDGVLFQAVLTGFLSFSHIHDVAVAHGQPGWKAWLYPLSVDLLTVAAYRKMRTVRAEYRSAVHAFADWQAHPERYAAPAAVYPHPASPAVPAPTTAAPDAVIDVPGAPAREGLHPAHPQVTHLGASALVEGAHPGTGTRDGLIPAQRTEDDYPQATVTPEPVDRDLHPRQPSAMQAAAPRHAAPAAAHPHPAGPAAPALEGAAPAPKITSGPVAPAPAAPRPQVPAPVAEPSGADGAAMHPADRSGAPAVTDLSAFASRHDAEWAARFQAIAALAEERGGLDNLNGYDVAALLGVTARQSGTRALQRYRQHLAAEARAAAEKTAADAAHRPAEAA